MRRLVIGALATAVLLGCGGGGLAGNYQAEIVVTGTPNPAVLERARSGPAEALELRGNGTFRTTRGTETVWEGTWKSEANRLLLRATSVRGVAVSESLQDDVPFSLPGDGTIVDARTSGDGYQRVYRRR